MHFSGHFAALAGTVLFAAGLTQANYNIDTTYDNTNFFNSFDFFTDKDPTEGFVEYVNSQTANQQGLAGYAKGGIFMGVDFKTKNPAKGRKSVRVTSKKSFTRGLFIADIAHMPGSICGAWPAYWMFGPQWPNSGEIDILEGVNAQTKNSITLHTKPGCYISNEGTLASTKFASANCGASGTSAGCGQHTADTQNYGDGFNAIGGGVYATEWTSDHIAVWFFPRSKIPQDIQSGKPNPASWGTPLARFLGGNTCNIDNHFKDNQIVFDTTFCGAWAGSPQVWGSDPKCSALAPTCQQYVSGNPEAFAEAYWVVNSVKVYQKGSGNGNGTNPTQQPQPQPSPTKVWTQPQTQPTGLPQQPTVQPQPQPTQTYNAPPPPAQTTQKAPQPQPTPSWNGRIWNGAPQPESGANSQPPPPPPPKQDNSWNGQVWNGGGWNAKRETRMVAKRFAA
ncbi:endo-1,3(4)-beta-glucanase [Pochonia chlamydosporia 170]|uniref:endo-1,3(4)-beta-glucanase n=1 Tax=Pochonia chlamydosporia 170 TaxID=1380566 RepID=A0A179FZ40_METCM|nr:endo-1,3(4)-beta-glucanase [Pochonia chlamydosporia 170]OAQ70498.1 endo-1,3(4)-beta-glucanase [Pochonia chlamydosporia 170]